MHSIILLTIGCIFCSRYLELILLVWDSQVVLVVKTCLPANARDIRNLGLIPGSGRSPGGGHGNSVKYSCLENPMDREVWRATAHRVTNSQMGLKQLNTHIHTHTYMHIYNYLHFIGEEVEAQRGKGAQLGLHSNKA